MGDYEHMDTETLCLASDPTTPPERLHEIACAGLKSSPPVLQSLCQRVARNSNTSVETLTYLADNTYNPGILNDILANPNTTDDLSALVEDRLSRFPQGR